MLQKFVKKDYAKIISQDLGVNYADVLKMTLNEIMAYINKENEKILIENMKDEDMWLKIKALFKEYDFFHQYLGDCLDRAIFEKWDSIFAWEPYRQNGVDYDDPILKDKIISYSNRPYASRAEYLSIRRTSILECITNAITERFPALIMYSPKAYIYSSVPKLEDTEIQFLLKESVFEIGGKEQILDDGEDDEDDFELDADDENIGKAFSCTLKSFFRKDIEGMIEEYLNLIHFYSVGSKDDEKFIKTNNFLSSHLAQQFFDTVRNLK